MFKVFTALSNAVVEASATVEGAARLGNKSITYIERELDHKLLEQEHELQAKRKLLAESLGV
jgi:hypothetical protein